MAKVAELTHTLCTPIAAEYGCAVWDVEYVREAGQWYLRVYIDKAEGISTTDCENVSRALEVKLDALDPIEGSYTLEVSSSGIERPLKRPEHFAQFIGSEVEVRLYRPEDGRKDHVGTLTQYDSGDVTISTAAGEKIFFKKDVAQVRLYVRV